MIRITRMYVNQQKMGEERRTHVVEGGLLRLSWTVESDMPDNAQRACRIVLSSRGECLYDSEETAGCAQEQQIDATCFPAGQRIDWQLTVWDENGAQSESRQEYFYIGAVQWSAPWICAPDVPAEAAAYFRREFTLAGKARSACMYVCGIGYQKVTLNGCQLTKAYLDPPHTDYTKHCQYVMFPEIEDLLVENENCIGVVVGGGWRENEAFGALADQHGHAARFIGQKMLTAMLQIEYEDGRRECIVSDGKWQAGAGMIVRSSLFGGETWNANGAQTGWDKAGFAGFPAAEQAVGPGGVLVPMVIPPVYTYETLNPICAEQIRPGVWLYDMGRNIAGIVRVKMPKMEKGSRIVLEMSECLRPDRMPDRHTLRSAGARDEYIFSGEESDGQEWECALTYHGFRYITVEGAWLEPERIEAVAFCTDLSSESFFRCGNALVDRIQRMIVDTERDNQHSILTDCPQRDERMGWMNDATVRFEETVSNFYAPAMMKKVVRDIMDAQGADGGITCTAPFVWGSCPADPVCSSFLIAAWLNYMHYGDRSAMEEGYVSFCAWENCLLSHSDGYIVNYSYYGDWAAPDYACDRNTIGDGAGSKVTPGVLMSTGYSFFNCRLLAQMAAETGRAGDAAKWSALAEKIKEAMLEKWYDAQNGAFGTDSMACLAFALWLEILPEGDMQRIADRLRDKLVDSDYHFTTGNLCTRYLFEVLTRFGHIDTAWELITREEYPSWGWMLRNEATTVWERFEWKDVSGMNSHNHPMYGAVGYWFYAYIAGIRPAKPGFAAVRIEPFFPKKLQHAHAQIDTVQGKAGVYWRRKDGKIFLNVQVPFGMEAQIVFGGSETIVGSGLHRFVCEE